MHTCSNLNCSVKNRHSVIGQMVHRAFPLKCVSVAIRHLKSEAILKQHCNYPVSHAPPFWPGMRSERLRKGEYILTRAVLQLMSHVPPLYPRPVLPSFLPSFLCFPFPPSFSPSLPSFWWDWAQGFMLPNQVLYCLSHTSSPFFSDYFGNGVS
jgi:hypothetical protein